MHAERNNIKITMPNNYPQRSPRPSLNKIDLPRVLAWIDKQSYDKEILKELKNKASSYPQQALPQFMRNIKKYLETIQIRRQNERKDAKN